MKQPNCNLSTKPIPARERLIFALDVSSDEEAKAVVNLLGESVSFYKIGLQLFMAGGYFELARWLKERNKRVMVDLKFFDVPETVRLAVAQLQKYGADFATVHGDDNILKAAISEQTGTKILAVTVLTSLSQGDIDDLGFKVDVKDLVLSRAKRALAVGCDGVISSGLEAEALRETLGPNFLIVMPGIRPVKNDDDQKRTVNVEEAFAKGADYIVVGRPISKAPDPQVAAEEIQSKIAAIFGH